MAPRTAGNRAVAELLEAPRATPPPPAVAQRDTLPVPTVAERLATADTNLKAGTLDDPIWAAFQASGGTANAIADRIWQGPLALSDVQPPARSRTDPAVKLRAALVKAVDRVVAAKLNERIKQATGKADADKVKADVVRLTGTGASWDASDIANQLWREWVGPASIVKDSAGAGTPVRLYDALKSAAGKHAGTLRKAGVRRGGPQGPAGRRDHRRRDDPEAAQGLGPRRHRLRRAHRRDPSRPWRQRQARRRDLEGAQRPDPEARRRRRGEHRQRDEDREPPGHGRALGGVPRSVHRLDLEDDLALPRGQHRRRVGLRQPIK